MVRKKQFINKKNAQHFHVVHRSQRDPKANDPDASKYVLLSSSKPVEFDSDAEFDEEEQDFDSDDDDELPDLIAPPSSSISQPKKPAKAAFPTRKVRFGEVEMEDLVDENGMLRDGYDYSQHLKEMGKGKFYSADGQFNSQGELSRKIELPDDVLPSVDEQERLLDAITLTTDTMDDDLREALVNDDAFEELDDDFVVQAAQDEVESGDDGFDYDAHIAKLMEAASGIPKYRGHLTDDEDEDDEEEDEELSDFAEEVDENKAYERQVLDEMFEKMMAEEYEDDQLGELEEDDPETRGDLVLEGDLLEAIVQDFVHVRQEMLDDEGKIGNPLRSGNRLQEILAECEAERQEEELAEEEVDQFPEHDAEATERHLRELFERSAYLKPREEEKWDCETIVSTYSNLDNHPTILREESSKRKSKKKKNALATVDLETLEAAAMHKAPIVLSKKTGMPLGVLETKKSQTLEEESEPEDEHKVQLQQAIAAAPKKKSQESKEEKKARKEAVKQMKKERREEKKAWKHAFKEEEQRQLGQTAGGKVSVFKY